MGPQHSFLLTQTSFFALNHEPAKQPLRNYRIIQYNVNGSVQIDLHKSCYKWLNARVVEQICQP